jgi:nitrite reductase/ring-hydroxylating ferredoxin subunit
MGRTLVIGDVHGCTDELRELLRACDHQQGDDVVFVGDLVAKGPDSRGVLALFRDLDARGARGNHDERVLRHANAIDGGEVSPDRRGPHAEIARSLDARDWAVLRSLRLWWRLPAHDALVVHAGLVPWLPLERQDPKQLMNIRTLQADGSGSSRADAGPLWAESWKGPELVLFGHHAMRGLQRHPFAIGLDTGCVYGGALSACILPEREIVSVPARRAYAPVEPSRPPPALTRVPVNDADSLAVKEARGVKLAPGPRGIPRQAILVRDARGELHAYLNLCRHMPIPIDSGGGEFMSPDGEHLLCRTHGACYQLHDGLCVRGPCMGRSLERLALERDGDDLHILDPG